MVSKSMNKRLYCVLHDDTFEWDNSMLQLPTRCEQCIRHVPCKEVMFARIHANANDAQLKFDFGEAI